MDVSGRALKRLHEILLENARLRDELAKGPRLVKVKRKTSAAKQAEIDDLKQQKMKAKAVADSKQVDMTAYEEKIASLKVKLNEAKSNKEFDAIKSQIAADEMANSVLEDEILEKFELTETLEAKIAEAEQALAELTKAADDFAADVAAKEDGLRSGLKQGETDLGEAVKVIPAKHKTDFDRVVKFHDATALAAVEGGACTSCQTTITSQERIDLKGGAIKFCRTCGRLLYVV